MIGGMGVKNRECETDKIVFRKRKRGVDDKVAESKDLGEYKVQGVPSVWVDLAVAKSNRILTGV